ncbi:hypothetical protein HHI36_016362 [Cryptolaemus montrouzieri]|uniref:Uncharacterized protein n=1 Tax=Cryptolaemus montrouzieri TaxID=559131 RepID=A0ABD2NJH9_9CUCU
MMCTIRGCLLVISLISISSAFLWTDEDCNHYCDDDEYIDWFTQWLCDLTCYDVEDETDSPPVSTTVPSTSVPTTSVSPVAPPSEPPATTAAPAAPSPGATTIASPDAPMSPSPAAATPTSPTVDQTTVAATTMPPA